MTSSFSKLKTFTEVVVPPAKAVPPRATERLILVKELDHLAKDSFPVRLISFCSFKECVDAMLIDGLWQGYRSLNRIQSIVYPTAYKSNENMLVCGASLSLLKLGSIR